MKVNMTDDYPTPAYAEVLTPFFDIYIWYLQLLQIKY